jgi:hypothetical protein
MASAEDELQRAAYALNTCNIAIKYNLTISVNKTKAMAMKGKTNVRTKIVINNHIIELLNNFNYLGYTITVTNHRDLEIKMSRFNQLCSTVRRTLNNKTRKDTDIKFCKAMSECSRLHKEGRNNKIREELNFFNINNKILQSRSQWKYHILQMKDRF